MTSCWFFTRSVWFPDEKDLSAAHAICPRDRAVAEGEVRDKAERGADRRSEGARVISSQYCSTRTGQEAEGRARVHGCSLLGGERRG